MKKIKGLKEMSPNLVEALILQITTPDSEEIINLKSVIRTYDLPNSVLDALYSQETLEGAINIDILRNQDFSDPEKLRRYYKHIKLSDYILSGNPIHFEVVKDLFGTDLEKFPINTFEAINEEMTNCISIEENSKELAEIFLYLLEYYLNEESDSLGLPSLSLNNIPGRVKFTNLRNRKNQKFINKHIYKILIHGIMDDEDRKFLSNLLLHNNKSKLYYSEYWKIFPYMIITDEMIIQKVINSRKGDWKIRDIVLELILEGKKQGREWDKSVYEAIGDKWDIDPMKYTMVLELSGDNKTTI